MIELRDRNDTRHVFVDRVGDKHTCHLCCKHRMDGDHISQALYDQLPRDFACDYSPHCKLPNGHSGPHSDTVP